MSMVGMFFNSLHYHLSSEEKQKQIIDKRLKKLMAHVKEKSPVLSEMYADIGEDFSLQDLPVTNKQMIMENYDQWVTDPDISLENLKKFMADKSNIGKRFMGKYTVVSTSGSTGYPLLFLMDRPSIDSTVAESMLDSALSCYPVCMLYSASNYSIYTAILMENMRRFPFIKASMKILDTVALSTDELVEKLNKIKPKGLYSYVSTMDVLANEYLSGRLKINLKEVVCGGEKLTEKTRQYLSEVFDCKVKSMYGCTEAGNIAYECDCNHFHLYNSWNIIEPVDADNNPVPYGEKAHKILLTNLSNYTVPLIRYEITDHVTIHDEPCPCGKKELWLEIDGRTNSALLFKKGGQEVKVSAMSIYVLVEMIDSIKNLQLVLHGYNDFEFRLQFMPEVDEAAVFDEAKAAVTHYLNSNGITDFNIYLSQTLPQVDPKTRKLKTVYQEF